MAIKFHNPPTVSFSGKYSLGAEERAGLELFYRYAAEAGVVAAAGPVKFFS